MHLRKSKSIQMTASALIALTSFGGASLATGQEPGASGLEEVLVTARQRAESIQDIPIAITAFTADDIQKRNIQNMTDLSQNTPGFNFENVGGTGRTRPVIRGATKIAGGIEDNVAFFLDGIYLPQSYVTDLGFSNVERVEVVKGPQSARYGRNAFMGAVNYVTKKPTDEFAFSARGTAGNYDRFDVSAAVSGPIIADKLTARISADYSGFDGSWRNPEPFSDISFDLGTDERSGGWEQENYSVALRFTPTDSVALDVAYFNQQRENEHPSMNFFGELNADSELLNCGQYNPDVRPAGSGFGGGGDWFRLFCGEIPVRNIPIDPRAYGQQLESDFYKVALAWDINDSWNFDYLFGRNEAETFTHTFKDTEPGCRFLISGLCTFESGPVGDFESDSHEFRFSFDNGGAITGSFGAFTNEFTDFKLQNVTFLSDLTEVPTTPVDVRVDDDFPLSFTNFREIAKVDVWSVFAEATITFMDERARFSAEARYSDEDKTNIQLPLSGGLGLGDADFEVFKASFSYFTPRFSLEYDLNEDQMVYVSAAKGVKSGGFNLGATLPENQTFDEDQNWTYELGSKNVLLDGRAQLNVALFYVDWSDVQIRSADPDNPNPLPVGITLNIGEITSYGIEADAIFAVTDELSIFGTYYYGDATYDDGTFDLAVGRFPSVCDDIVCNIDGDVSGNRLQRQSPVQATAGAEWASTFGEGISYYARFDVTYQAKRYGDSTNTAFAPARTLLNSSIGFDNDRYRLQFWGRNLTDEQYVANLIQQTPNVAYSAFLGERRTFGLTLSVDY